MSISKKHSMERSLLRGDSRQGIRDRSDMSSSASDAGLQMRTFMDPDLSGRGFSAVKMANLFCAVWRSADRPRCMRGFICASIFMTGFTAVFRTWVIASLLKDIANSAQLGGDYAAGSDAADSRALSLGKVRLDARSSFWWYILWWTVAAVFYSACDGLRSYLRNHAEIRWREWLVQKLMGQYLSNRKFYKLFQSPGIDNPGMRIADDTEAYTKSFMAIVFWVSDCVADITFASIMVIMVEPKMVAVAFVYSILGYLVTYFCIARQLKSHKSRLLETEAHFRGGLILARENAESIAFYNAGNYENSWADTKLEHLIDATLNYKFYGAMLEGIGSGLLMLPKVLPWVVMCNAYWDYNKRQHYNPDPNEAGITWGDVAMLMDRFMVILASFFGILMNLPELSTVRAAGDRVGKLISSLDDSVVTSQPPQVVVETDLAKLAAEAGGLVIRDADVVTPDLSNTLIKDLNLTLDAGGSLLIVGPSGVGKSSLLRAISGLWELRTGSISCNTGAAMFLPQNCYVPDIPREENTLEAQLTFPRLLHDHSTAEMVEALRSVNLSHLLGPTSVLTTDDWNKRLSNGEKQRLAMARLLLAKPGICFLDEATSALDPENERLLYSTLRKGRATYVSVGHKKALYKFHSHVLELRPEGNWNLREIGALSG